MLIKAAIVIGGTAIVSAVAAVPLCAPGEPDGVRIGDVISSVFAEPAAQKGDRLRIGADTCVEAGIETACAGAAGSPVELPPTITIERRIGESTSVLIRIPLSVAAR